MMPRGSIASSAWKVANALYGLLRQAMSQSPVPYSSVRPVARRPWMYS